VLEWMMKDGDKWLNVQKVLVVNLLLGHAHANPFFNSREYEVEFTDGTIE
jgi:hypothetical protein